MLIKFLISITGENGIPLKYISREKDERSVIPGVYFLEYDINCAPLGDNVFIIDVSEVSPYLISFISGNTAAETILLLYVNKKLIS